MLRTVSVLYEYQYCTGTQVDFTFDIFDTTL
jgi:hypothetical protein